MDFNELKEQVLHPQDMSDMFTKEDIEENKIIAALASFPLLFWLPIVAKPNSGFGKFYANQGLIFLIMTVVLNVLNIILGKIFGLIPFIGGLIGGIISAVIALTLLAVWLLLFISALQGKAREIPLLGSLFKVFQ